MSQNFADLILGADTRGLLKGKDALESTTKAGAQTEKAVRGTAKGFEGAGKSASTATPQVRGFGDATGAASGAALNMTKALGGLAAGLFSVQTATAAITAAKSLDIALSETATLLTDMPGEIDKVAASARGLADAYGTSDEQQVRAFYQAISGGAGSAAEATELLDAANKLAIGGITDVTSATGILTTAMNVYKAEGQSAADASDALFVAMKAGVTTIPELASALGAVLPYSQSLGVSFDETAAAVSALTKGGLTTAVATTGLRAALNSILAPTEQAKDLARDLSIEFNAAGLEAMGLAGFLQTVNEATGGSNVLLQQLFGSTEATAVALGFAGSAGESFTEILAQMNVKLGATEEAMSAVDAAASDRMDDALQAMGNTLTRMGSMVLPALATALEGAASLMALVADNSDALAIALGILAVRQIPAVIGGLITLSAWLATSEGLFIAGAIAAKGMALAMNLIPFVAVVAGATATYRAFSNNQQAAETLKSALQGVVDTQVGLNTATEDYYTNVTRGNLEAMTSQAQAAQESLALAVESAQARVKAAETAAKFGVGGYNLPVLIAELEGLQTQLFNAETRLSAADHAAANFTATTAGAAASADLLTSSTDKYTASTFTAIPAMSELIAKYGSMATSVRDVMQAQNDLAAADTLAGLKGLAASAYEVSDALGLSADEATALQLKIFDIGNSNSFAEQSRAAAEVAAQIITASGGLDKMDTSARIVVQALLNGARSAADVAANASAASSNIGGAAGEAARLAQNLSAAASALAGVISATANLNVGAIGLEAQNRALETGNTLIEARTAGLVAAKKAELASALGSSEGVIRAAATAELNKYTAAVERSSSAQEVNERLTKAMTASLGGSGGGGGGGLSKAAKDATKELDKMADEIERLEFDADPIKKYNAEIEKLDRLVGAGLSDGAYQKAVADLNEEFANSDPLISGIGDAIGDFVAGGMRSFGDLLDSFKNMIKQMIATAIANPIKLALTTAFSGGGTAAAAGQVAGAPGVGGGLIGGIGTGVSNFIGSIGGAGGLLGGASSVVSGLFSGGLGGAASAIGSAVTGIGSATTMIGGLGAAIGAIALPVAAVAAVFSFFKKKTKELDSGLRITADAMGTMVDQFTKTETKRFWGLSKKTRETYSPTENAEPIIKAVDAIRDETFRLGSVLGLAEDSFNSFAYQVNLSLKGLSEEDAQAKIAETLGVIASEYAYAALGHFQEIMGDVIRDGQTAGEALSELSGSLQGVNAVMGQLRLTTNEVSVAGAVAARNFADLFGGLDALNQVATAYYQTYYSDAERLGHATQTLAEQMDALYLTVPATKEAFRALVEVADAAGNRDLVAGLLKVAPLFAEVKDAIGTTADAQTELTAALTAYEQAVGREIARLRAEANTALEPLLAGISAAETGANDARSALDGAMNSLRSFVQAQISAANDTAEAAIEPLQDEIEAFAAASENAAERLEAAFSQVENNIDAQISSIQDASSAAVSVLQGELDGLKSTADETSAAVRNAFAALEQAVDSDIAGIEADLATAVDGLTATAEAARALADAARTTFVAVYGALTDSLDQQAREISEFYDGQIGSLTDAMGSAGGAASNFAAMLGDIESVLSSRRIEGAANELLRYRDAQEQIARFVAGAAYTQDQLSGALGGVSQPTEQFFSTRFQYEKDFAKTTANLKALRDAAAGSVSEGQQQINLLEVQVSALEAARDLELEAIAEQRAEAENLYNATVGILTGQGQANGTLAELQSAAAEAIATAQEAKAVEESTDTQITALRAQAQIQIAALNAILQSNNVNGSIALGTNAAVAQLTNAVAADTTAQNELNARQTEITAEIAGLNESATAQVALLNEQLTAARDQYNAALGIDAAITDVDASIAAMQSAIAEYGQAQSSYLATLSENSESIAAIEAARDAQIAALNAQLDTAQALYDTATGQAVTLTSIDAHMGDFNATLAEYTAAQVTLSDIMAINQPLIDSINATLAEQTGILETQLALFQDQFAPLTDLPTALATLQAAIQALADAQSAPVVIPEAPQSLLAQQLDTIYNRTLNRDADESGAAYYTGQVLGGSKSLADVEAEILASQEFRNSIFQPQLDAAYQAALGRAADQSGADWFYQQFMGGRSMADIAAEIALSPEAVGIPSYATGTNNHPGGLAMVGEQGPELVNMPSGSSVSTAPATRKMFDNSELVAEVRALRSDMHSIQEENRTLQLQLVRYTRKTADINEQWDGDGLPAERTA